MDKEWFDFIENIEKIDFNKKFNCNLSKKEITIKKKSDDIYLTNIGKSSFYGKIDYRLLGKIKNNRLAIDAKLDLHSMNFDQAYLALKDFLLGSYKAGHTRLLIITGKSNYKNDNTIRNMLEDWIRSSELMSRLVRGISVAGSNHGGDGAFYITLPRKK